MRDLAVYRYCTAQRRRGFTLVELLVVVGILAALIGVLLPTLSKAREYANRVKCAANLRSIGQALTMYTQQYGYYPAATAGNGGIGGYVIWPTRLRRFLGGSRDVFFCPSRDARCRWPLPEQIGARWGGYYATSVQTGYGYEPGEPLMTTSSIAYFSYGYNGCGTGFGPGGLGLGWAVGSPVPADKLDEQPGYREVRVNKVKVPAEMIAVADSSAIGKGDFLIGPYFDQHYFLGDVHGGGANFLFCDGHVAWYLREPMTYLPGGVVGGPRPIGRDQARMWNSNHGDF